jgi:hypothetical protein
MLSRQMTVTAILLAGAVSLAAFAEEAPPKEDPVQVFFDKLDTITTASLKSAAARGSRTIRTRRMF